MKTLTLLVLLLSISNTAYGQDVRRMTLSGYFTGIELGQVAGKTDFHIGGRTLVNYTVVEIAPNELKLRYMNRLDEEIYLATFDNDREVSIRDGSGEVRARPGAIRIMYHCRDTWESCRAKLQKVLQSGGEMQSLGVSNNEYPSSNILPEGRIIFAFLLREIGKF